MVAVTYYTLGLTKALYMSALFIYLTLLSYLFIYLKNTKVYKQNISPKPSKWIATLGLMIALAVIFQSAPVYLPTAGMILSPFSSLPIAIGTMLYPQAALAMFLGTAGILFTIHIEEAFIFLFGTGSIGLSTAFLVMKKKSKWKMLWLPSLLLTSGIIIMTYLIGIPGLIEAFASMNVLTAFLLILLFSIGYSLLWIHIISLAKKQLTLFLRSNSIK
jgi:hypothetical protein